MADRALPDLRARLLLDTTDLSRAQARTREFSRDLSGSLRPGEQSLASLKQHFNELPAATGAAQAGISRLGSALGGVRSGLSVVGESVKQVGIVTGTAFAAAGTAAIAFAGHATMVALRATEMDIALQALAKANHVSATALEANVTAIRHQGIEIGVAQNLVAEFVQGHLDLAKAQNLARVAQDAAVISGRNSTETLALLVQGIRTQQIDVLRSAGVTISAANAYKQYAQAHHIAETAITETQKQQILLDEVLKQGISIQGAYAAALETPSKQLRSIPRLLNDIELNIGQAFEPALGKVITAGYKLALVFRDATEKGQPLRALFDRAGESLTQMLAPLDRLVPKVKEFLGALTTEKIDHFLERLSQFTPVAAGVGAAISAMALRSIPVIGPFLGVLDPVVVALGALVATQPDLRALATAVGELASTGFTLFQTVAAPAVDALSSAVGPRLIPLVRTLTGVLKEVTADVQGGAPWWTTLAGAMSAAGFSTDQVGTAVGAVHRIFDAVGPAIQATIGFFQDLWGKAGQVAEVATQIGQTAWPQLQVAGQNLLTSLGQVFGAFGRLNEAQAALLTADGQLIASTDDTRSAFIRFMTSSGVIGIEAFFAVQLPASILEATSWLRVAADSVALTMNGISGVIRVTADIIKGDWGAAWRDMAATNQTQSQLILQSELDLATAVKASNEEMDGTVEQRTATFKDRMLHLFDTTSAGAISSSRQMKEDTLQQMREMQDQAVGRSIIPDMVNDILRWFARMKDVGVGEMYNMAVGVTNWAATLATNVRSNVSAGFSGALQVIHDFAIRINSVLGGFGVNIPVPQVSPFAQGPSGVHSLAAGGVLRAGSGGGRVENITAVVGEGSAPEYVIPTENRFRSRAIELLHNAAHELGIIGLAGGGILNWLPSAGAMVQGPGGGFSHQRLNAWDFMAAMNSRLYAGLPGNVSQYTSGYGGGYGNSILMNLDQGGQVILAHLAAVLGHGHVDPGALIGLTDNTGFSTGPHLHFEVRGSALNPTTGGYSGGIPGLAGLVAQVDIGALIRAALAPLTAAAHAAANALSPEWVKSIANTIIDSVAGHFSSGQGGATPPSVAIPTPQPGVKPWGGPGTGWPTFEQGGLPAPPDGWVWGDNATLVPRVTTGPMVQAEDGSWVPASFYKSIARARGGPVVPGRVYSVGERGPELFSPDTSGQIIPNGSGGTSMATVEGLLGQVVGLLGEINGTPQLSRRDASRRYAT